MEHGGGCWRLTFSRPFNDWKMDEIVMFLGQIAEKRVMDGLEDTVWWTRSKSGIFYVKAMYRALEQRSPHSFPRKSIWKNCVESKVSFSEWEAT